MKTEITITIIGIISTFVVYLLVKAMDLDDKPDIKEETKQPLYKDEPIELRDIIGVIKED